MYDKLGDGVKENYDNGKNEMIEIYGKSRMNAYLELINKRFKVGENIDIYYY